MLWVSVYILWVTCRYRKRLESRLDEGSLPSGLSGHHQFFRKQEFDIFLNDREFFDLLGPDSLEIRHHFINENFRC